jgi:hypothetical protein
MIKFIMYGMNELDYYMNHYLQIYIYIYILYTKRRRIKSQHRNEQFREIVKCYIFYTVNYCLR